MSLTMIRKPPDKAITFDFDSQFFENFGEESKYLDNNSFYDGLRSLDTLILPFELGRIPVPESYLFLGISGEFYDNFKIIVGSYIFEFFNNDSSFFESKSFGGGFRSLDNLIFIVRVRGIYNMYILGFLLGLTLVLDCLFYLGNSELYENSKIVRKIYSIFSATEDDSYFAFVMGMQRKISSMLLKMIFTFTDDFH